MGKEQMAG